MDKQISIIGAGNIGLSIAKGLIRSGAYKPKEIILSRRNKEYLKKLAKEGFHVTENNANAVVFSKILIVCVGPQQLKSLLKNIEKHLTDNHLIISVVSGISIKEIKKQLPKKVSVIRAMPNTASSICESITCLCSDDENIQALKKTISIFDSLGKTLTIPEENMVAATALGACGIAFFLRAIRAASQGGIEIGFHSDEAFLIASQTAKGAASLVLESSSHPESEIDNVTTPKGATISGINEMEHQGFSSALIKGITTSTNKIHQLLGD